MARKKIDNIDETLTGPVEPPAMNPRLGDLTPEYIQWYGENHTKQEFNQKYITRRFRIAKEFHKYFVHP